MKVNIEIDCTPDEARTFMGLPDVKPLQAAVLAKLEQQMLEGISAMQPDSLLKSWFGLVPGSEQMRDAFLGLMKTGLNQQR